MSDDKRSMFSYFKLKDAVDDVSHALDNKDKAVAGAKLVGKTLFNVGVFAGKMGAEMIKELPSQNIKIAEKALKNPNLTDEQREKYEGMRDRAKEYQSRMNERSNKK